MFRQSRVNGRQLEIRFGSNDFLNEVQIGERTTHPLIPNK